MRQKYIVTDLDYFPQAQLNLFNTWVLAAFWGIDSVSTSFSLLFGQTCGHPPCILGSLHFLPVISATASWEYAVPA